MHSELVTSEQYIQDLLNIPEHFRVLSIVTVGYPETPRRGILRIETTRGDRLFISLLGSAFLCVGWLFAFGAPLFGALILCLIYAAAVFRWV